MIQEIYFYLRLVIGYELVVQGIDIRGHPKGTLCPLFDIHLACYDAGRPIL